MELIFLQGYTEEEKVQIAFRYLIPRQIKENGITTEQIEFPEDAVRYLVRHYTREAGVRKLEQTIGTVCRKQARQVVEGNKEKLVVTREVLKEFLGGIQVRVETEVAERIKRPGVAVGLAWTPAGGDILFIEANKMKGKGNFTMTARSARSCRSPCRPLSPGSLQRCQPWSGRGLYQGHRPAHPCARRRHSQGRSVRGVTMATVLASLLTDTPVRPLTAMTGGNHAQRQCAAGGRIKEKFLAARRAGVQTIILPAENRQDVEEDLTTELIGDMQIHYASRIEDVLAVALPC